MFLNNTVKPRAPETVFGGSARSPLEPRARSPGPAAYMVPDALGLQAASTKISAPRPVFGKGGRESPLRSQTGTLGAGAYDLPPVLGHSFVSQSPPAYSLRPRSYSPDAIPGRYSPGPAVYDVPSTIGATVEGSKPCPPSFTMRPRTTLVGPKPIKPGPGEYSPNTSQTLMAAPSFSLRSRHDLPVRFAHADGPAAYDISGVMSVGTRTVVGHKPSSPAFSLRPRTRDIAESVRERQPSPSPGDYDAPTAIGVSAVYSNRGAFSIRGRQGEPRRAESPAPNAYDIPTTLGAEGSIELPAAPRAVFSRGERLRYTANGSTGVGVGPASYNIPSAFTAHSVFNRTGGGYSLNSRRSYGSVEDIPLRSPSPGPAAYEVPTTLGSSANSRVRSPPRPTFSRSDRNPNGSIQKRARQTPGVGAYALDVSPIKASSPSFSLRPRTQQTIRPADVNGPAAYSPRVGGFGFQAISTKPSGAAFSMTGRAKPGRLSDTPGPGAYGQLVMPLLERSLKASQKLHSNRRPQ